MKLITNKEQSKEAAIFLLNKRFGNLKEYRTKKHPNFVFYYNPENKEILMEQDLKTGRLRVGYNTIWSFFQTLFHYNYDEIQEVIKIWVEETFNLKEVTPSAFWEPFCHLVEETFNLKEVTPFAENLTSWSPVEETFNLKEVTPRISTSGIRVVEEAYNLNKNKNKK